MVWDINRPTAAVSSLEKLSISRPGRPATPPKKSDAVADSWEDEDASGGSDTETEGDRDITSPRREYPDAPPPTPASPTATFSRQDRGAVDLDHLDSAQYLGSAREPGQTPGSPSRRPEKTTAAAGRMIAGALGVRAPARSEEQKAYDKAMREKELKRREKERDAKVKEKRSEEEAKRAVWED